MPLDMGQVILNLLLIPTKDDLLPIKGKDHKLAYGQTDVGSTLGSVLISHRHSRIRLQPTGARPVVTIDGA